MIPITIFIYIEYKEYKDPNSLYRQYFFFKKKINFNDPLKIKYFVLFHCLTFFFAICPDIECFYIVWPIKQQNEPNTVMSHYSDTRFILFFLNTGGYLKLENTVTEQIS